MIVILKGQSDCNFIQLIFRQNIVDILDPSHYLYTLVHGAAGNSVVQYSPDHIAPLGIGIDPGNIFLRRSGIPDQKNIFQIIPFFSKQLKETSYHKPAESGQHNIDGVEKEHHDTGEMRLFDYIQNYDKQHQSCRIGRNNIDDLILAPGGPLGLVHIEIIIDSDIAGHKKIKETEIGFLGQSSCPGFRTRKNSSKLYIPCK